MNTSTRSLLFAIIAVIFWIFGGLLQFVFLLYPGFVSHGTSLIFATLGLIYALQKEQSKKVFSTIAIIVAVIIYLAMAFELFCVFTYQAGQGLRNGNVSDISQCSGIWMTLSGNKSLCISNVAIHSHNVELCDQIDKNFQPRCRQLVITQKAVDEDSITACQNFNFDANVQVREGWSQMVSCIETAARCNRNESLCDALGGIPEYKDQVQACRQGILQNKEIKGPGGQICSMELSF